MKSKGGERAVKQQSNNLRHRRRYQMKVRKKFLTLTIAGLMALLFCLPASVFAGPGPNSGTVPANYKTSGPSPKAFLMAGWKPDAAATNFGVLEAYVWVDDILYMAILDDNYPEYLIEEATASDLVVQQDPVNGTLTGWIFPGAIAEAYNFPAATTRVVVLEEKDVTEWCEEVICAEGAGQPCEPVTCEEGEGLVLVDIQPGDLDPNVSGGYLSYKHILRTNLKLTFLVPSTK
jgi:hypothetical protein